MIGVALAGLIIAENTHFEQNIDVFVIYLFN
jgi:hypothetical protein